MINVRIEDDETFLRYFNAVQEDGLSELKKEFERKFQRAANAALFLTKPVEPLFDASEVGFHVGYMLAHIERFYQKNHSLSLDDIDTLSRGVESQFNFGNHPKSATNFLFIDQMLKEKFKEVLGLSQGRDKEIA